MTNTKSVLRAQLLFLFLITVLILLQQRQVIANNEQSSNAFDQLRKEECFCLEDTNKILPKGSILKSCTAKYKKRTTPIVECIGPSKRKYEIEGWEDMKVILPEDSRCLCNRVKDKKNGIIPRQ